MAQITATTFVSLDGVMQAPGGPSEDTSDGFRLGGWSVPYGDETFGDYMAKVFEHAGGFLLGRRTYDIFASYWPRVTDPDNPIATGLNSLPKYVASATLTAPEWHDTTVLEGDAVAAARKLKEQPGDEIQIHGSGALIRSLLGHDVIDLHRLLVFPVYLGTGARLFPDGAAALGFEVVDRTAVGAGGGITALTLRPTGPARTGSYELPPENAR
ncbi:dihydrofolate reductase family protein [Streptomyces fuscigenes]|uniref:dihydrofolate reductase family protein n=1 Tax=Streptomyces fuscigenes TaxID=1528880 RepID=UPI001F373B34|nr:dihydrofolate reductase family protein [Streptomyces fuscigenes]MCF3963150.1 dihydrofolate reductase family protein [Streptomyces fuscigenes]